jgi:type II secretory pathway component PulF
VARTRKNTDEVLLTALACGATVDNAAHSAGMSARTVHRRLKEPVFQERLQQVHTDMLRRTAGMLTAAGLESVKTLITLQQTTNPGSVRLGAARSVLEMGVKVREASELAQRLAALEAQINAVGSSKEISSP